MNELEKNVLDDYDDLMDFKHDTIEDLKYDLNNLKIRNRIDELQKENIELKKQIEDYKKEVISVIEGSALDIEFKSDNQELVNRINKIDVRTK